MNILAEFTELERVYISKSLDESGLIIKSQRQKFEIIKLISAQEWLDRNYPSSGTCIRETDEKNDYWEESRGWNNKGKMRVQITKLDVSDQNLEGSLDLSGFSNLTKFDCSWNKITNLNITNNQQLTDLVCWDNQLKEIRISSNNEITVLNLSNNKLNSLDYSSLNPITLTRLFLDDNNFPVQELSAFSHLINLEDLWISNGEQEKIQKGIYNQFVGSLRPLANLNKLKRLVISNTDLNSGVEYLPSSLEEVWYSTKVRPDSKLWEIKWHLDLFANKAQVNWEELGFTLAETKFWIEAGVEAKEYDFADYLKNQRNLTPQGIGSNLNKLRAEYREYKDPSWQYIHSDFTPELQTEWKDKGFNGPQTEEWIQQGKLGPEESNLVNYLRKLKITPKEFGERPTRFRREYNNLLESQIKNLQERLITFIPAYENQPNKSLMGQLISQLEKKSSLTQEEINAVNSCLKIKKSFLDARQETIKELKKCFNELEKFVDKNITLRLK